MNRLPLENVRIVDLTMVWAGPFATKLLADMGAQVIKVEGPQSIDLTRSLGLDSITGKAAAEDRPYDRSAYFNEYNRNKLGLVLDLTHPRGREVLLRLIAVSDVVIENYRPDVTEKLGLGYERIREVRPDIIMVSMPGYAKQGRESRMVGYGPNIEQMSGLAALNGYPDGPPQKTGISYGDPVAGAAAAGAVLAALIHRRRTGRGQYVEVPQRDALISVIGETVMEWSMNRRPMPRSGNRHPWYAPHGCYPCQPLPEEEGRPLVTASAAGPQRATDRWITIAVTDDQEWRGLCDAMGRPDLAADPRFAEALTRWKHQDELDPIIAAWTAGHGDQELCELLQAKGVPAGPVLSPLALAGDPHLAARGFFQVVQHPAMGPNTVTRPAWRLTQAQASVRRPAPTFGQHTQEILQGLLGMSHEEVRALEQEGITSSAPAWRGAAV